MNDNFRRPRRQKISMAPLIMIIVCVILLAGAMWTSSISKKYEEKINALKSEINSASKEATELTTKNRDIEDSISELNQLIEDVKTELN